MWKCGLKNSSPCSCIEKIHREAKEIVVDMMPKKGTESACLIFVGWCLPSLPYNYDIYQEAADMINEVKYFY